MERYSLDIFCRIIDNYGDIGVCWRFARQLAAEHPVDVRLIVDVFSVFKKIEPALDERQALQTLEGVTLLQWTEEHLAQHYGDPGDVVIEAFACRLPDLVIERMKRRAVPPVWIDFEYLSAEDWVESCHAIPSFHPETGLQKTLFFPGFTPRTGGLIRERNIIAERSNFCADPATQNIWRAAKGIPLKEEGVLDISLFCYPDAPLDALAEDLESGSEPVRLLIPHGVAAEKVQHWTAAKKEQVSFCSIPFLKHADYDRLLWSCDINFVRGEDSWVRAIWAGKPFIWQAYPQDKGASFLKMEAFLHLYTQDLFPPAAEILAKFHAMWNLGSHEGRPDPRLWHDLSAYLPVLKDHARQWSDRQARQDDCATALIRFIRAQRERIDTEIKGTI
jgi:uncharacterized repeat protein (TIGR03837 family)